MISILSVIAYVFYIIAWFAVLITGSWPAPLRRFIIGYLQWNVRLSAYLMLATDQYPPLSFED
ncbi:DUF4389 domain-containing protein [Aeromicrobium sp. UC242_57]|uniref:DUF4389 domain-containing protein n=1 Tax=Aeromicrobium sp. UC242_57 TaxID=3374624 RepID=UPI0037B8CEBC